MVAALAYTLWFVVAGFGNHQDPLYWLYKYEHLEGGWMAVGTLLTGGAIVRLFGAQLLPLRLFGWLCTVAAIALPYVFLLDKEQRRTHLHWLALAFVFMGYGAFQEFSPGTLTVLLLSAIWVCATKSSSIIYHLSSIILGLAVAARFPNILALLVLLPLWRKRSLYYIPIAAATAGIVYLLGYAFITPSPMDAAMTSHDFLPMLTKLWTNAGKLILYAFMAFAVVALGKATIEKGSSIIYYLSSILCGLFLVALVFYYTKPHQWYNTDLTYLISAFVLVITVYLYPVTRNPSPLIGAAILIVATLGTDTAWLKLFPAVLCLLPVAAISYEASMRRYLFIVLAIFSTIVVYRMTTNSIGNNDLTKTQTISSVAPYTGIAIRQAEQSRLLQYKTDKDSLSIIYHQSSILSVGQENHLLRSVTGCEAARFNEFWSNIYDSVYTAKYREIIVAEHPIVFCSFSPQFKTKPEYQDTHSCFENMLLDEGYQPLDRSKYKYMIYIDTLIH